MIPSPPHLRAILFALGGYALWVFTDACIKLAGEAHFPPAELVAVMGVVGATVLGVKTVLFGQGTQLRPQNRRNHLARAVILVGVNFANAVAVKYLPLTVFYTIIFLSPMVISIMAAAWLRERLAIPQILAIVTGFIGVVIAINPFGMETHGATLGYVVMIASVILFSLGAIIGRALMRDETPDSLAFSSSLFQAIIGSVMVYAQGNFVPFNGYWLVMLGVGGFNILGNVLYLMALRDAKAAHVSAFHYSQLVFGAVLGYLIWGDVPTPYMIAGAAIIVGSGFYIAHQAHRESKAAAV